MSQATDTDIIIPPNAPDIAGADVSPFSRLE